MDMYSLKLTRPLLVGGKIVPANSIVEVDEQLAKNLLHRSKAVLATEDDAPAPVTRKDDGDPPEADNDNAPAPRAQGGRRRRGK